MILMLILIWILSVIVIVILIRSGSALSTHKNWSTKSNSGNSVSSAREGRGRWRNIPQSQSLPLFSGILLFIDWLTSIQWHWLHLLSHLYKLILLLLIDWLNSASKLSRHFQSLHLMLGLTWLDVSQLPHPVTDIHNTSTALPACPIQWQCSLVHRLFIHSIKFFHMNTFLVFPHLFLIAWTSYSFLPTRSSPPNIFPPPPPLLFSSLLPPLQIILYHIHWTKHRPHTHTHTHLTHTYTHRFP